MQEEIRADKPVMLAERIAKCVRCGYSFAGLPLRVGACPECGLKYDEWSRVFEGPVSRSQIILTMVLGVGQALASAACISSAYHSGISKGRIEVLLLSLGIVTGASAIFYIRRSFVRKQGFAPRVTCLVKGFYFMSPPARGLQFHSWADFSGEVTIECYSSLAVSLLYRKDKRPWGRVVDLVVSGAFQSQSELEDFIEIVEAHLESV